MGTDAPECDDQFVAQLTEIQLPLLLYVRSLLPGDPAARDVAQQANTTIWQKRASFAPNSNFKAWAFQIARYEVLNHHKRRARDRRLVFHEDLAEMIASELAESRDDLSLRHEALRHCLTTLRPRDRELILHRYGKSGTLQDYANHVGRSVAGLKVTLHRLRNALLDCIQRQLRGYEGPV